MSSLNAQQALDQRRTNFAKKGMIFAALGGITQGLNGSIGGIASGVAPFNNPEFTVWGIIVAAFITAGLLDFISGFWVMLYNKVSKRTITEYIRLIRTKVGIMLLGGALLGGPLATLGFMSSIFLCGATYGMAIFGLYPIVGALAGAIFLKEKLTARAWAGIVVAVVGAFIIGYAPPSAEVYPYFYVGLALAFMGACGGGLEGAVIGYANDMSDPQIAAGIFRTFGSGLIMLLIVAPTIGLIGGEGVISFHILGDAIANVSPVLIIALAALCSSTTIYMFYPAVNMCGVGRTMVLCVTSSGWSIVFGFLFRELGFAYYEITTQAIIGVIVLICGTALTVANPKKLISLRK